MPRVGLLGFGSIAEHGHLPALQRFDDVEVVAIADLSETRLALAHTLAPYAALFDSPRQLIEDADIDILDICTPPRTHEDLIHYACARGIRTIACEKPFVLSEDEFARVARTRHDSGARIVCVNNWFSSDLNRLVSQVLDRGELGAVRDVRLLTARPQAARGTAGWIPAWRTSMAHAGGGIILDHGWHQLYLVFGWMRRPLLAVEAVTATRDPRNEPVEDLADITLYFQDHGQARIELSWTAQDRRNEGLIQCDNGEIEVHDDRIVVRGPRGDQDLPFGGRLTQSSYHPEWFQEFFRCTILDVESEESDRNFAEAGLLVRTVGAAYLSGRNGGVRIPVDASDASLTVVGEEVGSTRGGGMSGPQT